MNIIAAVLLAFIMYVIIKEMGKTAAQSASSTNSSATSSVSNSLQSSNNYLTMINQVAQEYGLNPGTLFAIAATEQGTTDMNAWNAKAYNPNDPSGAFGLTQVLSDTANELGISNPYELFNPYTALSATAKYLVKFSPDPNNVEVSAQVYNAGPSANFVDTSYIEKALKNYNYFEQNYEY
jgi:soluble lytic murein transglycosylase-like protein